MDCKSERDKILGLTACSNLLAIPSCKPPGLYCYHLKHYRPLHGIIRNKNSKSLFALIKLFMNLRNWNIRHWSLSCHHWEWLCDTWNSFSDIILWSDSFPFTGSSSRWACPPIRAWLSCGTVTSAYLEGFSTYGTWVLSRRGLLSGEGSSAMSSWRGSLSREEFFDADPLRASSRCGFRLGRLRGMLLFWG